MAGTVGAVADISLQITAKQRNDGRGATAGRGSLGNPVGLLRVGEDGNQNGATLLLICCRSSHAVFTHARFC
jgi:hypothetical protein